jgi:hypothetical protein
MGAEVSGGQRFKRSIALARAQELIEQLRPACVQIEIAGSLRRGKESVGDIEIVAMPKVEEYAVAGQLDMFGGGTPAKVERASLLDKALETLVAAGEVVRERPHAHDRPAWGDKYKKLWARVQTDDGATFIQVDLFIVTPPAQYGAILAIRTGPAEFGQAIMRYVNAHTLYRQDDGRLVHRGTGQTIETPTERRYFEVLGLAWVEPSKRDSAAVKRDTPPSAPKPSAEAAPPGGSDDGPPQTSVVNIKSLEGKDWRDDPNFVYVGRAHLPRQLAESDWANPFRIGPGVTRDEAIAQFRVHLHRRLDLLRRIPELVGKTLVCWCAPEACHADILADLANRYARGKWRPPAGWRGLTDEEVRLILRNRIEARAGIGSH